jgi:uncharacterized protein (DUF697 family)/tellurite resistance protein
MTATQRESVASLRLLVCLAKADGVLHDKERATLESSLADIELPDVDLSTILAEEWEVEELAEMLESGVAREQAYQSAYALAYADGDCSDDERALLDRLKEVWSISDEREAFLQHVFSTRAAGGDEAEEEPALVLSPREREDRVRSETRKTAVVSAVLGAFPLPLVSIATDLAIVGLEIGLAKDIAKFWGKQMDTAEAKGLLASFGVGTAARIAVSNLFKVLPGWGSAVGAATAYASSFAVGVMVNNYYKSGEGISRDDLKAEFKKAKAEGKKAYAEDKHEVDAKMADNEGRIEALTAKLERGEIDQAQFEREVASL